VREKSVDEGEGVGASEALQRAQRMGDARRVLVCEDSRDRQRDEESKIGEYD